MPIGYQGISINKSAPDRIIISALEVIQPGAYGTLLATGPFLAPIWAAAHRRPRFFLFGYSPSNLSVLHLDSSQCILHTKFSATLLSGGVADVTT